MEGQKATPLMVDTIARHLNWLLNVLPWACPALTEAYRKISGKTHQYSGIYINSEVREDLTWIMETIPIVIGIRFFDNGRWEDCTADMVICTDASLQGVAFVLAGKGFLYPLWPSPSSVKVDILFYELLAILSAVEHAATLPTPPPHLLIWTDSLDSVAIFDFLQAREACHNVLVLAVAKLILISGIDLRIQHISGKENLCADLLSHLLLDNFFHAFPSYQVHHFEPPRHLLREKWRTCF